MATTISTYYSLVRLREMGPEAKNWAVTDSNFEVISLLLKAFEQHAHSGAQAPLSPGFSATTVSISSPATFTSTGHGLIAGDKVSFLTTGALPTGLSVGVIYYVIATGLTANAFEVSTTLGGTAVNTSGSQSGTISIAPTILTEVTTGGSLTPGVTVGVRLSYVNALGLETNASTEVDVNLVAQTSRPLTPILSSTTTLTGGLAGGTYIYVITKGDGSGGETEASDILPVTIPYDNTYQVALTFDAINSYTDGTTILNIYRSAGLSSSFQLIRQISGTTTTTYTDNNTVQNTTQQPPSIATFDRTRKVNIDWSTLTYPSAASQLNVYVTQQPGVWGNSHLLSKVDLTSGSVPTNMDYLGSETLDVGYPYESSQIPNSPAKVDLATQATGGFVLTADGNFQQHQAKAMVFENLSAAPGSPVNGQVYYDTVLHQTRGYINSAWTNWGQISGTGYTHPSEETGGHMAANIRWASGFGSPNLNTLLGQFFTAGSSAAVKQQTVIDWVQGPTLQSQTSSTTNTSLPNMTLVVGPAWIANQWCEIIYTGQLLLSGNIGDSCTIYILMNGSIIGATVRSFSLTAATFSQAFPMSMAAVQRISNTVTTTFDIGWYVSSGSAVVTALATRSYLTAKTLP